MMEEEVMEIFLFMSTAKVPSTEMLLPDVLASNTILAPEEIVTSSLVHGMMTPFQVEERD